MSRVYLRILNGMLFKTGMEIPKYVLQGLLYIFLRIKLKLTKTYVEDETKNLQISPDVGVCLLSARNAYRHGISEAIRGICRIRIRYWSATPQLNNFLLEWSSRAALLA